MSRISRNVCLPSVAVAVQGEIFFTATLPPVCGSGGGGKRGGQATLDTHGQRMEQRAPPRARVSGVTPARTSVFLHAATTPYAPLPSAFMGV